MARALRDAEPASSGVNYVGVFGTVIFISKSNFFLWVEYNFPRKLARSLDRFISIGTTIAVVRTATIIGMAPITFVSREGEIIVGVVFSFHN